MRWIAVAAGLAVVAIVILMALVLGEGGKEPVQPPPVVAPQEQPQNPPPVRLPKQVFNPKDTPEEVQEKQMQEEGPNTVHHFGEEFEKRWRDDRDKLGPERHAAMEKLWFEGRRPRGEKQSIAKLEEILRDYPDTNRAGCAAYELGHQYIRARGMELEDQRKNAEQYWNIVTDRYHDTLCEYNEPAAASAEMSLAMWVYRYTDKGRARQLLQDLIDNHKGETDHLGQPLSDVAKRMLENVKDLQ